MPAPDGKPRVLILGGTGEARTLAVSLCAFKDTKGSQALDVVSSLAGRTRIVSPLPGRVRIGGFGGVEGMAAYLETENVDLVVDATHPFATGISHHAYAACERARVVRLWLERPAWCREPGDSWVEVDTMAEAAAALPRFGQRIFLSTGRRGIEAFSHLDEHWFLVRLVDMPDVPLPLPKCTIIAARGPFDAADEQRMFEENAIDAIVCKASGGSATAAKLAAARALGLPVLMIRRPSPPPGVGLDSVSAAVAKVATILDVAVPAPDTPLP